jgi:hypothetical protein
MKSLGRVHGPGYREAEGREREGNQKNREHHQQEISRTYVDSDQRGEGEKDQPLNRRKRRTSQNFAQNDRGAWNGRDQHREQEAFFAVFDHRHHGEDRSEQYDHDQRAGIEVIQIVLLAG